MRRRDLTVSEAAVLRIVQQSYGSQNTAEQVFFTDADEAAIFVKAAEWHVGGDGESYQSRGLACGRYYFQ
jgi:hypothetical protein